MLVWLLYLAKRIHFQFRTSFMRIAMKERISIDNEQSLWLNITFAMRLFIRTFCTTSDGEYIGCFSFECLSTSNHSIIYPKNANISMDNCTLHCQEAGYWYASIHNRLSCSCSCQNGTCSGPLEDRICGVPCGPDWIDMPAFCGGIGASSLYEGW